MQHHYIKSVLLATMGTLCALHAFAQEKSDFIQAINASELPLYAEPLPGSKPVKSLDRALVPLPLRVQERKAAFARIQLGAESYWIKADRVRFSQQVSGVIDCQSSKDPLTQQSNPKLAAIRGADGDCR